MIATAKGPRGRAKIPIYTTVRSARMSSRDKALQAVQVSGKAGFSVGNIGGSGQTAGLKRVRAHPEDRMGARNARP